MLNVSLTFLNDPEGLVLVSWFLGFLPREKLQGDVVQFVLVLIAPIEQGPESIFCY